MNPALFCFVVREASSWHDIPPFAPLMDSTLAGSSGMKRRISMKQLLIPIVLLSLAPLARTQSTDTIKLVDGTKIQGVKLSWMDVREVRYKVRSSEKSIEREKVRFVDIRQAKARGKLRKAIKAVASEDWAEALTAYLDASASAKKSKTLAGFLPQYALWKAFEIALDHGDENDRLDILSQLKKEYPETFYLPQIWDFRIRRAYKKAGNDRKKLTAIKGLVANYLSQAKDWGSTRSEIEAELEGILIRERLREIKAKDAQKALSNLLGRAETDYPDLANRLSLQLANAVLRAGKLEEAREMFESIIKSGLADSLTMAKAYLGRGHTWFRKPSRKSEDSKKALLDYMRVATLYPKQDYDLTAEALYYAIESYKSWGGPDLQSNVRRLIRRLKGRYRESTWAKK
jgi:hypothetical protein